MGPAIKEPAMNDEPLMPLIILAASLAYVIQADETTTSVSGTWSRTPEAEAEAPEPVRPGRRPYRLTLFLPRLPNPPLPGPTFAPGPRELLLYFFLGP